MADSAPASTTLDREFLNIRSRLVDLAAMLDRISRQDGVAGSDPRMEGIRRTLELLAGAAPDARGQLVDQVQMVFSRPYRADWRREFGL